MYHQLKQLVAADITFQGLAPGDVLDGEHGLCERFGVSRTVVRQALSQLEREGVLERVKGKGTFVAQRKTAEGLVHTLSGLYEEVEARGGHVRSVVRQQKLVPADKSTAESLEIAEGDPVVMLERLRFVNGAPWSWSTTYLPDILAPILLDADFRDQSLYSLLASNGVRFTRGLRSVEATVADTKQAGLLEVRKGDPLLLLRSIAFVESGRPMETFEAFHRGDRSRFEFAVQTSSSESGIVPHATRDDIHVSS